jgi:AraC family transcriptional regulator of adaptative response/methylated-DNA-[protein]-cysteine methyltransferase
LRSPSPRPAPAADDFEFESKSRSAALTPAWDLADATAKGNQAMPVMTSATATETLRFGYGETSLGTALVAASDQGVAAIFVGDDRRKLHRDLAAAFPGARLVEDETDLADVVVKVCRLIETPHQPSDLALDLRGSELELAVWSALRAIPAGEVRTYGAIAKSLPLAATAQAVGAACAANVLAVAIPCHRVVKADGSISGYRWGVPRKRRLINREGVA